MKIKTKKGLIVLGILAITFMLSGCFFSEQQISIDEEGKAEVSTTFWFNKSSAGDEGTIAIQSLLFSFLELQTNYEFTERAREDYITFTFRSIDKVDINQNKYITFIKREDGSYYFEAKFPKIIEEKSESNKKALVVRLTLPAEIEMANSMNYEGHTVEWEIRENDFTRDITLKAFTKPSTNEATTERTLDFFSPEQTVRTLIEAAAFGNEDAVCDCFSFYLPPHLVGIFIQHFIDGFSKALGEKQGIERETAILNMVGALSFEKERINNNTFYVWVVNLDTGKRINEAYFHVELEDQEWKVFNPEGSEEQWFEIEKLLYE